MDNDTKATFRALIGAIEALADSMWDVYDLREDPNRKTGKVALLAPNPQGLVETLLAAAKGLVDGGE